MWKLYINKKYLQVAIFSDARRASAHNASIVFSKKSVLELEYLPYSVDLIHQTTFYSRKLKRAEWTQLTSNKFDRHKRLSHKSTFRRL